MKCAVCGDEKTLIVGWSNGNNLKVKWERDPCPACQPPPHSFHAKQKAQRIIALSERRRDAVQDRG